nr:T9SS type A sorting domain-containing protein [Saprospiraceae bacterium]
VAILEENSTLMITVTDFEGCTYSESLDIEMYMPEFLEVEDEEIVCSDYTDVGNAHLLNFTNKVNGTYSHWSDIDNSGVSLDDLSEVNFLGVEEGNYRFVCYRKRNSHCPISTDTMLVKVVHCELGIIDVKKNNNLIDILNQQPCQVSLYNTLGQEISRGMTCKQLLENLQSQDLPLGVYFYYIQGENNKSYAGKFLKM